MISRVTIHLDERRSRLSLRARGYKSTSTFTAAKLAVNASWPFYPVGTRHRTPVLFELLGRRPGCR